MECFTPYSVNQKHKAETIPVPCGKCPNCRKRRASGWSFRLMQQNKIADSALFITLTYDTATVPIHDSGYLSLRKSDLQNFFKRLRKAHTPKTIRATKTKPKQIIYRTRFGKNQKTIKYYAVGEYGTETYRPHYHIILFNADISLIQKAWNAGSVHYGNEEGVTGASCGYTLKYITKPPRIPLHKNDDRIPEFSLMSKGLGQNYLSEKIIKWHKATTDRMYLETEESKKIPMPRYYKDKIWPDIQITDEVKISNPQRVAIGKLALINHKQRLQEWLDANPNHFRDQKEYQKQQFRIMYQKQKKPTL